MKIAIMAMFVSHETKYYVVQMFHARAVDSMNGQKNYAINNKSCNDTRSRVTVFQGSILINYCQTRCISIAYSRCVRETVNVTKWRTRCSNVEANKASIKRLTPRMRGSEFWPLEFLYHSIHTRTT